MVASNVDSVQACRTTNGEPSPYVLIAEDVSVHYRAYTDRRGKLSDFFANGMRRRVFQEVKAVRNLSLRVRAGEGVGVIGANGSGKSTLLRALAGVQPLTGGRVLTDGQPRLLGVGAALKPALSGRRNIMMGCLALGLNRKDAEGRMDQIIDFSGIPEFIDMPMNTYSTGMRARLSFAIATSVAPRILLIDEVLAVGDRDFKRRSLRRLDAIREEAGTVFLVSHSLGEVRRTCDRVLWMDHGHLREDGPSDEVIAAYKAATENS